MVKTPFCVQCGSKERLQLGHLFSRVSKSTIFEWDNLFIQCETCNNRHEQDPTPFTKVAKMIIGLEKYNYLEIKSKQIKKWRISELKELLDANRL